MIGSIQMPDGSTAILEDNGRWSSDDDWLRAYLNINHAPRDSGLSVLFPVGVIEIESAAARLGATVTAKPKVPALGPGKIS